MTDSKHENSDKTKARVRKALPKSKKLNNSQMMKTTPGGAAADQSQVYCPTPQQPGYNQPTHVPLC
jgi:hypothetical protein